MSPRPGDRFLVVAFATLPRWDPLIVSAIVAWAHLLRPKQEVDVLGRPKQSARAGLTFDYESPESTYAMYEMPRSDQLRVVDFAIVVSSRAPPEDRV